MSHEDQETVSGEHLDTVFSALSSNTRKQVIREIDRALQDTCVEYHRHEGPIAQKLYQEILALQVGVASLKRVDQEYDIIITRSQCDNGSTDGSSEA